MITVIEEAPSTRLTTKEKVKALLGISDTANDTIIDDMIDGASQFAVNFIGRPLAQQQVKESLAGKGLPDLLLSLTPLISVTSVLYDTTAYTDYVIYDKDSGILQRSNAAGFTDTNLRLNTIDRAPSSYYEKRWHVTYWGGYRLPSFGVSQGMEGPRLPFDLERAIIEMVKAQYHNMKVDGSMTRYRIGETEVHWDRRNGQSFLPSAAEKVLEFYRRPF